MPKKSEPLHEETTTEKAIRLMGREVVIQTEECGETCALYGIPAAIRPADPERDKARRLYFWDPLKGRMWHVPMSIITEIEAHSG